MESQPERGSEQGSWPPFERFLIALCAVGAAGFAAWVTGLWLILQGATIGCTSSNDPGEVAAVMLLGAVFAAASALCWLVALSLVRVAAGRRGLRTPMWMFVPLGLAVLATAYVAVATAQQPADNAAPFCDWSERD